jgi:hypothetical protein
MTITTKFQNIAGLELDLRIARRERERVGTYTSHAHKMEMNRVIVEAQTALFSALDGLTTDELVAFGEYRANNCTG